MTDFFAPQSTIYLQILEVNLRVKAIPLKSKKKFLTLILCKIKKKVYFTNELSKTSDIFSIYTIHQAQSYRMQTGTVANRHNTRMKSKYI